MSTSLRKIGVFQFDVCRLLSAGAKERISDIADEISNKHLIEYLYSKYTDADFAYFGFPFDTDILLPEIVTALNSIFANYYSPGCERKYCLYNDDDGLVLLLDLIAEKIQEECINWHI